MRKILYVSGTRADFGLMASTLQRIAAHPQLQLQLAVTGMHLSASYGMTVREIEALGLPIAARVPIDVETRTASSMAQGIGQAVVGLTTAIAEASPDVVLVLGDRGEMLAGAIAALHLGIPIAHLHGGERSGTVDESVRHAITKLSHWHFVATEESRDRVIRLGERVEHVFITGAPSLDDVAALGAVPRGQVLQDLGLAQDDRFVLVLFHPVVQEMAAAQAQAAALAQALVQTLAGARTRVVWLDPNADAGSAGILEALQGFAAGAVCRKTHLPRSLYIAALRHAEALVGNSSSGIIEAATFGTPVVNVGNRQRARERNPNTIDCGAGSGEISVALDQALAAGRFASVNRYGDGRAGQRIAELLATLPIDAALLDKVNTY